MKQVISSCSNKTCRAVKRLDLPLSQADIEGLKPGDRIEIFGNIYTGRDAVLPKIVADIENGQALPVDIDLQGSAIFHTAVSPAGVGPTSSNKQEIEESIAPLSAAGVKLHLGKGALSPSTVEALAVNKSLYAVLPPVTALLQSNKKAVEQDAYPEEGVEALHKLTVEGYPAIIAVAHGKTLY